MTTALTTLWIRISSTLSRQDERGASLVEYALLAALIAIVCLTSIFFLGSETSKEFDSIGQSVDAAT